MSRNRAALEREIDTLLVDQARDHGDDGRGVGGPARFGDQRGPAFVSAGQVVRRVPCGDPVVGGRIPDVGVDAVSDPDQPIAERSQSFVQPHALLLGEDLPRVVGAHRDDPIDQLDRPGHRIGRSPRGEPEGLGAQSLEPVLGGDALMTEGVDGEHQRYLAREEGGCRGGVPVVEMDDVGRVLDRQGGDRRREREEALVVVGPALSLLVDVGVRTVHAGNVDQIDRTDPGVVAATDSGPADPVGHGQVVDRLVVQ